MSFVTVKPEFRSLTEDQVLEALGQPDDTPVALELARLLDELAKRCAQLIRQNKSLESTLNAEPSCPLEKLALEMVAEAIKAEAEEQDEDEEDGEGDEDDEDDEDEDEDGEDDEDDDQ